MTARTCLLAAVVVAVAEPVPASGTTLANEILVISPKRGGSVNWPELGAAVDKKERAKTRPRGKAGGGNILGWLCLRGD